MVVGIAIAVLWPDQTWPVPCCDCGSDSPDPGAAAGPTSISSGISSVTPNTSSQAPQPELQ